MILLMGFYEDTDAHRRDELLACFRRNVENDTFDQIHVLVESPSGLGELTTTYPLFAGAKVRLVAHGRRVTYRDLFAYGNAHLPHRRVVVANADIYFDDTLALLDRFDLSGRLLCLSRWDVRPDGSVSLFDREDSQDAWLFETPIREFACDFHLGLPGCDNRIAWEAEQSGLLVSNPSRSIRANHLHLTQVRRYSHAQRVAGPVRHLPPVFLETPYPGARGPAPDAPLASVAFRESMGYTVEQLVTGVSSHSNENRPFATIPDALLGLPFTQIVAFRVAPVEVTFLTPGKLYVLVGDDRNDSRLATDRLNATGFREPVPLVLTQNRTGFEVWSLVGQAGERFVIPTQVMLVAGGLTKAPDTPGPAGACRSREPIFALTSLPPGQARVPRIRECLRSWRAAGLQVRAFNHPDEIRELAELYDVEFVPVTETTAATFGRHFVPVHAILDWAVERGVPALLLNADIYLRLEERELNRVRRLSAGGLCYFVRHNYIRTLATAYPEPHGIDAVLFHGRDLGRLPRSSMSLGQPFWDYWLPYALALRGAPIRSVEFPAAFHENHPAAWTWETWRLNAIEFARVTGEPCRDGSFVCCQEFSSRVRRNIDQCRVEIAQHPFAIRDWVTNTFTGPAPKTFLELGAHQGTDTEWLARIPNVTLHAFEPDPRNHPPRRHNVRLHRAAVADRDGTGPLIPSESGWGRVWTQSSSIKQPKNCLTRFPLTFGDAVNVELVTLDTFHRRHTLQDIDFIWADIQGAEGEMIRGGRETLARTRYLYTEYSDDEMYEGQVTLDDILRLLPDFRVLELWPEDVLLVNRNLVPEPTVYRPMRNRVPDPLVSCIMPTHNRRAFVPLAVQNFLAQDYPHRELIVIDDGSDPVADLVEGVPGVRYYRLPGRVTIGEKRNLACDLAAGTLIVHWDDDDWYSPRRLSYQAEPILAGRADITGLVAAGVLVLPKGEFWAIQPWLHRTMFAGDVSGGTLMFRKVILDEEVRYPPTSLAEDANLLRAAAGRGYRLCRLPNAGTYMYMRHGSNAWQFDSGRFLNPNGWWQAEVPATFPPEALERYRTAARTG